MISLFGWELSLSGSLSPTRVSLAGMSATDARTRRKISLQPARVLTVSYVPHVLSTPHSLICPRLGTRAFPKIVLSNILFVLALFAAKESLLSYDVGVFWVLMRVLALGALGMLVWEGLTLHFSKGPNIEVGHSHPYLPYCFRMP